MADNMPDVKGSALQLEQVVINLIQNALQALPDQESGVQVTTGYDAGSNEVFVRVSDEGNGIPKELSSKVMEPFFTTRLELGGTGLGLSICSAIVKDHGGTLDFSSNDDCGTTFTVRLPATDLSTYSMQGTREGENGSD
jgi:C4-dicarboxylate-specific signal transduction histidine kinase